jgi:putative ABC transport system substrate-binding protein
MSYGANIANNTARGGLHRQDSRWRQNPPTRPVLQPTKFELVINLKTAKGLGHAVPPTLLARADEVIE